MVTRVELGADDDVNENETIASEYSARESERNSYLERARLCANLTVPTLMPPAGHGANTKFSTPYQGVGARGVNNIASKLLLALFPPRHPFFRLAVDDVVLEKMGASKGAAEEALSIIENRVVSEVNDSTMRVQLFEGLKQLIVAGNVLVYLPPKTTKLRVFRMDRYVVTRDPMGNLLELIVKEDIAPEALPKAIRDSIDYSESTDDTPVAVYTKVEWEEDTEKWVVSQEIQGKLIESSKATYPKDMNPWLPLRLIAVDNEDYGRSYVEEYLGDLTSLEGLTKAIVESSAAAAKLLIMVSPNGTTRKKTIAESPNLAVVEGNAADVTFLRTDKQGDFGITSKTADGITERLSYAFMLNSAVQRKGERVTAEEIRYMASELEDALGGIYSVLAQELQLPLVTILMSRMQKQNKIPAFPKGIVKPTITTGMEALGRSADLQRLDAFLQSLSVLGPDTLKTYLNVDEYIKRRASALQIETKGLIRSQAEVQAEQQKMMQQQAMMQMAQAAVPNAVKGVADMASNAQQQPEQGQPANG